MRLGSRALRASVAYALVASTVEGGAAHADLGSGDARHAPRTGQAPPPDRALGSLQDRIANGETAWRDSGIGGVRGLTVGPIQSSLHPGKGYGSAACAPSLEEARDFGATL